MIALTTTTRHRVRLALLAAAVLTLAAPWSRERASAAPNAPNFGPIIENYAQYDGQDECKPKPKPGVVAFKNMVLNEYPGTGPGSISRACNVGGKSEHKEGRAWDWGLDATKAKDRNIAQDLFQWLMAVDKHGHKHALARRLGIMYIIWNRKMWGAWDPGWEVYCVQQGNVCKDPDSGAVVHAHRDHVHFSFSWKGARKNTTYWNPQNSFNS
jgi:hypothetical protein